MRRQSVKPKTILKYVAAVFVALGSMGAAYANAAGPDTLDVDIRAVSAAQWYGDDEGDLLTLKLEVTNNADFPMKFGSDGQSFSSAVFAFAPTTPDSALPGHEPYNVLRAEHSVRVYYSMWWWLAGARGRLCVRQIRR